MAKQPPGVVYVIVAVVPEVTPVTTPVVDTTEALDALLLLHVPPDVPLLSVSVWPSHTTCVEPVIAVGDARPFTVVVVKQLPSE